MKERDLFSSYGIRLDEPEVQPADTRRGDGPRFLTHLTKAGEHWLWKGETTRDGQGVFHIGERRVSAKQFSWELANGAVPDGSIVMVTCELRTCVHPDHLRCTSRSEMMRATMDRLTEVGPRPRTARDVEFRARRAHAISTAIPHVTLPPEPVITRLSTPPHARNGELSTAGQCADYGDEG